MNGIQALFKTTIKLFNSIINSDYNLPYVIIIEDDVYKVNKFNYYWTKINEFINNKDNTAWDFISLDHFLNFERPRLEVYNDFLYKINKSRATGFMIYNTNFLRKNIRYLESCSTLDLDMKHNGAFIQLIPKEVIIKQEVNKISNTGDSDTSFYEDYYIQSEQYLVNYFL